MIDKMFSVFKSHNLPCVVGAAQCDRQDVQCVPSLTTCLVSSEQRNVIDKMFSVFKSHNLPCVVGAAQCDRQDVQCVQVSQPALCRRSSAM